MSAATTGAVDAVPGPDAPAPGTAVPGTAVPDLAPLLALLAEAAPGIDATGDPDGVGVGLLREHQLLDYLVPAEFGGRGGDTAGLLAIAEELGAVCPGLALLWVMHSQQVAIVAEYAPEPLRGRTLREVAERQLLIGSITTESGKGGHVLSARAALDSAAGVLRFHRDAPVVSGGAQADAYLVTMRRAEDAAPDDVVLVLCPRERSGVAVLGSTDMLGMRGTANVSLSLDVEIPADHLIDPPGGFPRIATRTMAPLAHLGWSAVWVGAARAALRYVVRAVRGGGEGPRLRRDDDVLDRLARARARVDTAEAMVLAGLAEYRRRSGAELDQAAFQILVNNVKVVAAEQTWAAVNELVEVAGLGLGYQRGLPLERTLRDLRSAALMYGNHRLVRASGRLGLVDAPARSMRGMGLAAGLSGAAAGGLG